MRITTFLLLACAALRGQPAESPTFEVASIKPAAIFGGIGGPRFMGIRGGPGSPDPGQITVNGMPVKFLLTWAYDMKPYQVTGPAWLDSERFDILAKVPHGATKEQARVMMQSLLAERFHMKLHHETKEMKADELTVAKNGPKLKESSEDPNAGMLPNGPPPSGPPKPGPDGFISLDRPGQIAMVRQGPNGTMVFKLTARAQPLTRLVEILSLQTGHPVVDKTGLKGNYDYKLEFAPENMPGGMMMGPPPPPPSSGGPSAGTPSGPMADMAAEPAPSLAAALQQQLGLHVESRKTTVDIIVIDSADKTPEEN